MLDLHDELDAWLPKFGQKWAFDKQKGFDIARGKLLARLDDPGNWRRRRRASQSCS